MTDREEPWFRPSVWDWLCRHNTEVVIHQRTNKKDPGSIEDNAKKMRKSFKGLEKCLHQAQMRGEERRCRRGATWEGSNQWRGQKREPNTREVHCKHRWKQHEKAPPVQLAYALYGKDKRAATVVSSSLLPPPLPTPCQTAETSRNFNRLVKIPLSFPSFGSQILQPRTSKRISKYEGN